MLRWITNLATPTVEMRKPGKIQEASIKRKKITRLYSTIWLIVVFIYMLFIPTSSGPMFIYYFPEKMREAVIPDGFLANCSIPVDEKWITKASAIRWVAYSSPNTIPGQGRYRPTTESIYADLTILKKAGFNGLVTYGSSGIMGKEFLTIAQSLGYQGIIMGIWNPLNQNELNNARNASSLPIVMGYGIGNEGLYGNQERYTISNLCSAISDLRFSAGKPVTTSEEIDDYYVHTELLFVGDWFFPIAHPYWHSTKYPQEAVKWETTRYKDMVENTDRFVFFKEVGLPTSGAYGLSETNHDLYYRELAKTNVRFVYFEGFDQPSKTNSSVEPFWGIFNSTRKPKLLGWNLMGYRLFTSDGANDGLILECSETSGKGCDVDTSSAILIIGDDSLNRQYRAFLSFNTAGLPDNAVITSVKLKAKPEGVVGANPFDKHRRLKVDACPFFGSSLELQPTDFQAGDNCANAGIFNDKPDHGWYIANLNSATFPYINLAGTTQFRLRYNKDDNNDNGADYTKFYSGNAADSDKPILLVRYYIP
jgi:exo-beta-1,3-glucanase (GH17 family)